MNMFCCIGKTYEICFILRSALQRAELVRIMMAHSSVQSRLISNVVSPAEHFSTGYR